MIFLVFSFFFLLFSVILYLYVFLVSSKNEMILEKEHKINPNILLIIPARNESAVIENLLLSIQNQTFKVNSENVIVIVEDERDPTINIVLSYHMNYFVRKNIHLKTKGYAIDELLTDLSNKHMFYDCYFIFDADNVLESTFLEKMLQDYQKGYTISTGYRALKNRNHYFPLCAGLTFFMVNEMHNKRCMKHNGNLILSGTGYYIHGRLIKEWKCFPFHSLTEDYESSLYYTLNGISTHYNVEAIFYDEQPYSYKQSITQRSRWIKGYFYNWRVYFKLLRNRKKERPHNYGSVVEMEIGILPFLFLLLAIVFFLSGILFFMNEHFLFYFLTFLFFIYFLLVVLTAILIKIVGKRVSLEKHVIWKALFYHPIFLLSYIHAFFRSLKKSLGWDIVEHGSFHQKK